MIPKVIHYCWFGRNPLPKSALKCIASWRRFLPDYEIKEWNEDNFNVNIIPYTQEAYKAKKYAFVSDFARFWILYNFGGVYFDTDVELIRSIDDIVSKGPFMGIEKPDREADSFEVASGLGLASENRNIIYRDILESYKDSHFILDDGSYSMKTVVKRVTPILQQHGFNCKNELQEVGNIIIYPYEFFCPIDSTTGIMEITKTTRTIHHFSCSWLDHDTIGFKMHLLKNIMYRIIGPKFSAIYKLIKRDK